MTVKFDPAKFDILSGAMYFGVFSASGTQVPLEFATVGGVQPLHPQAVIAKLPLRLPHATAR